MEGHTGYVQARALPRRARPARPSARRAVALPPASEQALQLNIDDTLLFSGASDGRIRCWRTGDGACVGVMEGHTHAARSPAAARAAAAAVAE